MKKVVVISTSLRAGSNSQVLAEQFAEGGKTFNHEPGTNDEIQSFCSLTYNVTFPIFDKIDVNGENESPLYTYLKAQAPFAGYPEGGEEFGDMLTQIHQKTGTGFENGDAIKWNFGKFLVSRDGKTIIRFEPMVSPEMMGNDIEKLFKIF